MGVLASSLSVVVGSALFYLLASSTHDIFVELLVPSPSSSTLASCREWCCVYKASCLHTALSFPSIGFYVGCCCINVSIWSAGDRIGCWLLFCVAKSRPLLSAASPSINFPRFILFSRCSIIVVCVGIMFAGIIVEGISVVGPLEATWSYLKLPEATWS